MIIVVVRSYSRLATGVAVLLSSHWFETIFANQTILRGGFAALTKFGLNLAAPSNTSVASKMLVVYPLLGLGSLRSPRPRRGVKLPLPNVVGILIPTSLDIYNLYLDIPPEYP